MRTDRGFIGFILLIIIALILAKYFYNFSVFQAASSPQGQQTISYTQQILNAIWSVITFIWKSLQTLLMSGKTATSTPAY